MSPQSVRSLLRSPSFALAAVPCFALSSGAAISVFSLFDAVLLRQLDFKDPDRLVALRARSPKRGLLSEPTSGADVLDWQRQGRSFESMAAFQWCRVDLPSRGQPQRLEGVCGTHNFLAVLGAEPQLGRSFSLREQQGDVPVGLISRALWRDRFDAGSLVGNPTIELRGWRFGPAGGRMHTVIGVLPGGLRFFPTFVHYHIADVGPGTEVDFLLPIRLNAAQRDWREYDVIARLKPGVTIEQAQAEMDAVASRLADQYPQSNDGWEVGVIPLHEYLAGDMSRELTLLFGAVGLVLVIGVVSFVQLAAQRGTSKSRELARVWRSERRVGASSGTC